MRVVLAILTLQSFAATAAWAQEPQPQKPIDPRILEVHLEDDGKLRAMIADAYVEIETQHGTLRVPAAAIRRIEMARRLPADLIAKIDRNLANLASPVEATWKAAAAALVEIDEPAAPALLRATRTAPLDVMTRARNVLDSMQEQRGEEPLELREHDLVQTADCRIVGRITSPVLNLQTSQFGPLVLKINDARSLQSLAFAQPAEEQDDSLPKDALPDPGSLSNHQQFVGQSFLFKVTGSADGSVWGTNVYTSDSALATAAVHAGIVKVGETGVVQVKIVSPPASFNGTARNGIATSDYGPFSGAFEVKKPKKSFSVK